MDTEETYTSKDWADGKIRTRANNPFYTGPYTLIDYRREFQECGRRISGLSKEGREFNNRFTESMSEEEDGPEAERYRRIVREAVSRYIGPREWGHGFGTHWEPDETTPRGIYYTSFYELTDEDAIESILTDIEMEADRWTFLDSIYDDVLRELENHPQWIEDQKEIWGIYNRKDPQDVDKPDAEEFAQSICETEGWKYWEGWLPDIRTPEDPDDLEERDKIAVETIVSEFLRGLNEQLDIARNYKATGKVLDKRKAIGTIIRATKRIPKFGKDGELSLEPLGPAPEIDKIDADGYIWEINPSRFSDYMALPVNSFMNSAWKNLAKQQRFNDDGTLEMDKVKEILLESNKNKNDGEWLKANILTKGYEPPSFAEVGFIEQIGNEMETAVKEGRSLIFTEIQLCKCRYGTQNRINDTTRKRFAERFDELCNMKVFIRSRGEGLSISPEVTDEKGERLKKIVGEEVRLMDPRVEYRWTGKKQDKAERVYIFEDDRAPIHCINAWHGNIVRPSRDLLQTDAIPADKLSTKGRAHYDKENLKGRNKRNKDQLYLDPITYGDLKYCILHQIGYAYWFTQKKNDRLVLNLEEAYEVIYKTPAPPKSSTKWKDYVKAVYTYLTFLIEKGAIEDYRPGKEFKKDSGIAFIDVDRSKNLLSPPE